ncbi:hypothetical protein NEOLEDRAFT_1092215 [Neolentinus lepideus HHB14362 ss-1]|uniref:Uncharacterized protein n=1 Tax=Neolentinus lepideus HHB14362 ss-1 TaxID=1314782 RepID=A0A165SV32_9AGAM|nr:hypothetical protein NEOLEDRAFT_1092215 [Neolentinus lepideus HHB14362 ss-1]
MFWCRILFWSFQSVIFSALVHSGSVPAGGACSTDNNRVENSTRKFLTDCDDKTFCSGSSNGTCTPKKCRRDEFPFGYNPGETVPALCSQGSFCPDDGSGCQALVDAGGTCELNRDEQCKQSSDWDRLSSHLNFNGSICLQSTCVYANATLGQRCFLDNTTYVDPGPNGQQVSRTIIRDNCRTPSLFCHQTYLQCLPTKPLGLPCLRDQECQTAVCVYPPETPLHVSPWQSVVTTICILSAMAATCTTLVLMHKRQRLERHRELREYYHEQLR